jgi:hypothetical protein
MGIVFSSFASCFMFIGEILSYLCLGIGELGSILVHGIFGLIVGICDVLAACMCCCQVPFSDRPDRDGYTYSTVNNSIVNLAKSSQPPKFKSSLQVIEEKSSSEEVSSSSLPEIKAGSLLPPFSPEKQASKAAMAQGRKAVNVGWFSKCFRTKRIALK